MSVEMTQFMGASVVVVIPCYNEAARLPVAEFLGYSVDNVRFLLVDDGSQDATASCIEKLVTASRGRYEMLRLPQNVGKAEAVRHGVRHALAGPATVIGYFDADLSAPLSELAGLCSVLLADPKCQIVMGSRVQMLGHRIQRSLVRHYMGRVFATMASLVLELPVYDTQCGAKVFRREAAALLFEEPFIAGWSFDVELLARYRVAAAEKRLPSITEGLIEHPLMCWRDIAGSKVKPTDFLVAMRQLLAIRKRYRHRWCHPVRNEHAPRQQN